MFDSLKRRAAGAFLANFVQSLATDKNTQTTVAGMLAGVVMTIHGLDWSGLVAGDPHQLALVVSAVSVAVMGLLATRENHDGHTTMLGVTAGVAQGFVGNFSAALTIALCGYLTNKRPSPSTVAAPPAASAARAGA